MNIVSADKLALMAGARVNENMRSVALSLDQFGARYGLDHLHRLAHFLAQLLHESGRFRYDREVWGPTPAQARYDTRTDLGNTPAKDGDGKKNAGRGPMQLTGAYNIAKFYEWCVAEGMNPPDFRANPDLINTDPWEGLSAIWYWAVGNPTGKSLNVLADENNIEQITKRINGGLHGFPDRLDCYVRVGLVLAGFGPTEIAAFQTFALNNRTYDGIIDSDPGPKTRAAIHLTLAKRSEKNPMVADLPAAETVTASPVVEKTEVAVAPAAATKRGIPWSLGGLGILAAPFTWFFDLDRTAQIALGSGVALLFLLFLLRGELIIRRIKQLVAEVGN